MWEKRWRATAVHDAGANVGTSAYARRLGLRREVERHAAFVRAMVWECLIGCWAGESAVDAARRFAGAVHDVYRIAKVFKLCEMVGARATVMQLGWS